MSKNKRDLTADEKRLWRRVAASVKTRRVLAPEDTPAEPATTKLVSRQIGVRTHAPMVAPAPAAKNALAPLPHRGGEKRVRRGKLEIGGTLDLHGHTQESGRAALARFLQAAQARGDGVVIVVTGMGRGGEGVLKRRLPEWLGERELRPLTTGYAPAHRSHGGAGAFYVFIKRARETHS